MDWIDQLISEDRPMSTFEAWFAEAKAKEPRDPDAMALGTVDSGGMPNQRMVLLRQYGEQGFTFHTNRTSAKGSEIAGNGKASLLFHWKSLGRQIRMRGAIAEMPAPEVDAYFAGRPYGSRIGAWASLQSTPLASRDELSQRVADFEKQYPEHGPVPRPEAWVGYRFTANEMEFWREGEFRLHDRVRLTRENPNAPWAYQRLFP